MKSHEENRIDSALHALYSLYIGEKIGAPDILNKCEEKRIALGKAKGF